MNGKFGRFAAPHRCYSCLRPSYYLMECKHIWSYSESSGGTTCPSLLEYNALKIIKRPQLLLMLVAQQALTEDFVILHLKHQAVACKIFI